MRLWRYTILTPHHLHAGDSTLWLQGSDLYSLLGRLQITQSPTTTMKLELIMSINTVVPTKGTNAGKTMYVINGKYWSKSEPKPADSHVCLEDTEPDANGKTYTNVVGFSSDTRMSITEKIKTVTNNDAAYASAIAFLLK